MVEPCRNGMLETVMVLINPLPSKRSPQIRHLWVFLNVEMMVNFATYAQTSKDY